MKRTIIGLLLEDYHDGAIESVAGGSYAIDVRNTLTYLDGAEIQHGHAAEITFTEREVPQVAGDDVVYEEKEVKETLATEFFADFDSGFVAVDSSDGECLFESEGLLFRAYHINVTRAHLDVAAFAEYLQETYQNPTWWQVGWREEDADGETLDAGVSYHRGTRTHSPTKHNTSQLGFSFRRSNGERVRGTCAASGYVEVYDPEWEADAMARWLQDDVLPFCSIPADDEAEQQTLDEETAAQELCARCSKTAREKIDGEPLCLAHYDQVAREEEDA